MSNQVEALKQFFAAINRNDMQAMIKDFDPHIVRVEPEGFPTAGTYRGTRNTCRLPTEMKRSGGLVSAARSRVE